MVSYYSVSQKYLKRDSFHSRKASPALFFLFVFKDTIAFACRVYYNSFFTEFLGVEVNTHAACIPI